MSQGLKMKVNCLIEHLSVMQIKFLKVKLLLRLIQKTIEKSIGKPEKISSKIYPLKADVVEMILIWIL